MRQHIDRDDDNDDNDDDEGRLPTRSHKRDQAYEDPIARELDVRL